VQGNYQPVDDWVHYNADRADPNADFSVLDTLESYRQADGFTLKIVWPDRAGDNTNVWKQTNNPVTDTDGGVTGYEAIDCPFTSQHWGGLEHGGGSSLLDGSVDHQYWFYAIGSSAEYGCGIPGAQDCEGKVELYAHYGGALTAPPPPPPPPPPTPPASGWTVLFRQTAGNYQPVRVFPDSRAFPHSIQLGFITK